jgi:copper(I)-binding protein
MLFGLRRQLSEGDRFPIELQFEQTGVLTPEVIVVAPGAPGPPPS